MNPDRDTESAAEESVFDKVTGNVSVLSQSSESSCRSLNSDLASTAMLNSEVMVVIMNCRVAE